MEDSKTNLVFDMYRFQIAPIYKEIQLRIDGLFSTREELISKKNILFSEILSHDKFSLVSPPLSVSGFELQNTYEDFFIFTIQVKKTIKITTVRKKKEKLSDFPYLYIIVFNDKDCQKIAIQKNTRVFPKTSVCADLLERSFSYYLKNSQLDIVLNPIFVEGEFWNYIDLHKNDIKHISFEFNKRNLSTIRETIGEEMSKLLVSTNGKSGSINIDSHSDGSLLIDKSNISINNLVKSASSGSQGDIKVKIKKRRSKFSTKNIPTERTLKEAEISNLTEEQALIFLNNFFRD